MGGRGRAAVLAMGPGAAVLRAADRCRHGAPRSSGPVRSTSPRCFPRSTSSFPTSKRRRPGETDAARFQLFDSTATFLRAAALTRPLLVVLDDLQAADPSSLRLLRFVASQLGDMRVLIIGTYRDVELTPDHPLTDRDGRPGPRADRAHHQPERAGPGGTAIAHRGDHRHGARRAAGRGAGARDEGQPAVRSRGPQAPLGRGPPG